MPTFSCTNNPIGKTYKTEPPNPSQKPKNNLIINIETKTVPKYDKLLLNSRIKFKTNKTVIDVEQPGILTVKYL